MLMIDESLRDLVAGDALLDAGDALARAVTISLFTWRRAAPDDDVPDGERWGWWGDTFPTVADDRIGSRLWLLARSTISTETVRRAEEYILEALDWMIQDGVVDGLSASVERFGDDAVMATVTLFRDGRTANLRFNDLWRLISRV